MALQKEKKLRQTAFKKGLEKENRAVAKYDNYYLTKKASALPFFVCQKSYDISKKVYKNRNM